MDYLCIILCLICFVQAEPESIIPSTGPGGALYLSFAFAVSGALAGGYDCNEYESCELLFKICVNSENSGDCDLFNVTTSPVRNVASVAYEGSSAFRFSFRPPTNKIRVVIEPCDYDFKFNAVPIGRFYSIVLIENITSKDTPLKLRPAKSLFVNEFKIKASMRKECNPGFFGHICQYHIHKSSSNMSLNMSLNSSVSPLPANKVLIQTTDDLNSMTKINSPCARAREMIGSEVCLNYGICHDSDDGASYVCYCPPGYSGARCELLDFCSNITCSGHGKCENAGSGVESFVCNCEIGWRGILCEVPDQSACELAFRHLPKDQLSICLHGGVCVQQVNGSGFQCQCGYGWTGERCETHFIQTPVFIVPTVVILLFVIFMLLCVYVRRNFSFKVTRNLKRPSDSTYEL